MDDIPSIAAIDVMSFKFTGGDGRRSRRCLVVDINQTAADENPPSLSADREEIAEGDSPRGCGTNERASIEQIQEPAAVANGGGREVVDGPPVTGATVVVVVSVGTVVEVAGDGKPDDEGMLETSVHEAATKLGTISATATFERRKLAIGESNRSLGKLPALPT